jgi:hypothetical protein
MILLQSNQRRLSVEEFIVSKSGPLRPTKQTSMRPVGTSPMGEKRTLSKEGMDGAR